MKPARQATLGAWLFGLASIGLAWVQARWYVFHPHYLPLCLLFIGLAASTLLALACCLWRIIRGPHRTHAATLAAVAMLPAGFWADVGITAKRSFERRWVPNTCTMRLAKVMGAMLMCAEMDLEYRHRLETNRLVMYYDPRHPEHPERVDRPEQDLAAMDRHLARLEHILGGKIAAKVYWIRGRSLGVEFASFHGLSLGSAWSPETVGNYRGDRHELAHAALDWFRVPGSNPPYVLHEGWAMAQCGDGRLELAQAAENSRRENPSIRIQELLGPDWYYRDAGPVYSVGGAFVDFLIRTRGAPSFVGSIPSANQIRLRRSAGKSSRPTSTIWRPNSGRMCKRRYGIRMRRNDGLRDRTIVEVVRMSLVGLPEPGIVVEWAARSQSLPGGWRVPWPRLRGYVRVRRFEPRILGRRHVHKTGRGGGEGDS